MTPSSVVDSWSCHNSNRVSQLKPAMKNRNTEAGRCSENPFNICYPFRPDVEYSIQKLFVFNV